MTRITNLDEEDRKKVRERHNILRKEIISRGAARSALPRERRLTELAWAGEVLAVSLALCDTECSARLPLC